MVGVIFLEGVDLHLLLGRSLLLRVLQLPLHIVRVPGHQVLQLVPLLLRSNPSDVLLVGQLVALGRQQVDLFELVLEHELQLLDVTLVELVALQPLLLQQLHLQRQAVVVLRQLASPQGLALLGLRHAGLQSLCLKAPLCEFAGELVVVLGQEAILLQQAFHLQLELFGLAQLDLEEGNLVEQPPVLGLAAEGVFEGDFLFDEIALDSGGRAAGVGRGLAVV